MTVHYVQVRLGRDGALLFGPQALGLAPEAACLNDTTATMRTIAPASGDAFLDIVGEDGAVTSLGDGYIKDREWSTRTPIVIDPMARPLVRPQHLKFFVFEDLGWGQILEPRR